MGVLRLHCVPSGCAYAAWSKDAISVQQELALDFVPCPNLLVKSHGFRRWLGAQFFAQQVAELPKMPPRAAGIALTCITAHQLAMRNFEVIVQLQNTLVHGYRFRLARLR